MEKKSIIWVDKFYGVNKVASVLGISRATIYRYIDEGLLPAYRIGKTIKIKGGDIDSFITPYEG